MKTRTKDTRKRASVTLQSYAMPCNPLKYTQELITQLASLKTWWICSEEHMVYTRAPSVDIFDRVINRTVAATSSNEPLLCNEFPALRLIVSHVGSVPSLSLHRKGPRRKRGPDASAYIMSNTHSCPLLSKTWRNAALGKSSWSCYVRRTAGGTPTLWARAHTYTELLSKN